MGLSVKDIKVKDARRGIVAINSETLADADYDEGAYVTVSGHEGRAVARVWEGYAEDDEPGVVRMDEQLRTQIGVEIEDQVDVTTADVVAAERVEIEVDRSDTLGGVQRIVRRELTRWAVEPGQTVEFSAESGPLGSVSDRVVTVSIDATEPDGKVVVTDDTDIDISGNVGEAITRRRTSAERTDVGPGVSNVTESALPSNDRQDDTGSTADPDVTFEDIGGLDREIRQITELVEMPLCHPELFEEVGIDIPRGVLLHGPPGTGKTLLARAVANEIDAHFVSLAAPEVVSEYYGRSEAKLRDLFEEARQNSPTVVFVDEIDAIAGNRESASGDLEQRIVAQLLSLMDGVDPQSRVVVVASTNRVDDLDPALRRGGRFDHEIEIGVPDGDERAEILDIHTEEMPMASDVDLDAIVSQTHGFVGADLALLAREAAMNALRRVRGESELPSSVEEASSMVEDIEVTAADFEEVMEEVEPSGMREMSVEVPVASWDDVGGLETVKSRIQESIQWPLQYADAFRELDLSSGQGLLLYGPPGTGKTLLARAVASEADSNFISVRGPELLDKYVGESEEAVRRVFERAEENSPAVVFFDEFDALATARSGDSTDGGVSEKVVSQLLTEIDGLDSEDEVAVIATTNRPDLLDPALLRSGRFEQHLRVPVPDDEARREILDIHTADRTIADEVDLDEIAERTELSVGADLESICRQAAMAALRETIAESPDGQLDPTSVVVGPDHFETAMSEVTPSVTEEMRDRYDEIADSFADAVGDDSSDGQRAFY